MVPTINYWAVIIATLSSMVVGSIWYLPRAFGNAWMKLVGVTPSSKPGDVAGPLITTLLLSFVTAWVLAGAAFIAWQFYGGGFLWSTIATTIVLWAGFSAARHVTHDAFEKRPSRLTMLSMGNDLVTLLVMAIIIGVWPVA